MRSIKERVARLCQIRGEILTQLEGRTSEEVSNMLIAYIIEESAEEIVQAINQNGDGWKGD